MTRSLCAFAAATLAFAGLALAVPQKDTFKLSASLTARFEVPRPTGVRTGAAGLFTGTAVELQNDRVRLAWRLTFSKLSGRATAAHIHKGRPGKAGGVLLALCGPCRSGQRGSSTITHAQLRTIRAGTSYVNIHTAKNAAGEIRGQLKAIEVSSSSDPTPSPPPPPPPTYP